AICNVTLAKESMVGSGKLYIFCARDMCREITSRVDSDTPVADPMQHQRRNADRRENVTCIDFAVHFEYSDRRRGPRALSFPARKGTPKGLIRRPARRHKSSHVFTCAP